MTPEQKEAFNRAVIDVIVAKGAPVSGSPSPYMWQDPYWEALSLHARGCGLDHRKCTWTDSQWTEFVGTEYPDEYRKGIDATVTCRCGVVRARAWRYTGGYAELIRAVTEK